MTITAEYKGVSYMFDPRAQAMKDLGITEETAENRTALAKKTLEYTKVGQRRAETGARLRWAKATMSPAEYKAYLSTWNSRLMRRVTSAEKSLVSFLTCDNSAFNACKLLDNARISSGEKKLRGQ
jgi:hypothetical protein